MARSQEGKFFEKKKFFERQRGMMYLNILGKEKMEFRCSFRVSIEVLLVARFEQRANSWPCYPSERLGEGV